MKKLEVSYSAGEKAKLYIHFGNQFVLQDEELSIDPLHDPITPVLGICSRETKTYLHPKKHVNKFSQLCSCDQKVRDNPNVNGLNHR